MERIKLFCFPYAGGSSLVYRRWKKYLHEFVELCPVELSGRGARGDSYIYESFRDVVDDVYSNIKENLKNSRYAFFGHSMGAVIAYELYYKLKECGINSPEHIFFSGRKAPGTNSSTTITYNLPDDQFKKYIVNLGGASENTLESEGFSQLYLPLLRRDVKLIELYEHVGEKALMDCDISILSGIYDKLSTQNVSDWEKHTSKKCSFYLFESGHFFINSERENVIKTVNSTLLSILTGVGGI